MNQKKKKNQQKIHFLHIEKKTTSFSSTLAINEQDERIIIYSIITMLLLYAVLSSDIQILILHIHQK